MKIFIVVIVSIFSSVMISAQELTKIEKVELQEVKVMSKSYEGLTIRELLMNIPKIGMLRIMPNNPQNGTSTFIFGFTDNETFSKALKKDRITVIVNSSNLNNKNILDSLYKVNITTDQAIKKYGDIKILSIIK